MIRGIIVALGAAMFICGILAAWVALWDDDDALLLKSAGILVGAAILINGGMDAPG